MQNKRNLTSPVLTANVTLKLYRQGDRISVVDVADIAIAVPDEAKLSRSDLRDISQILADFLRIRPKTSD